MVSAEKQNMFTLTQKLMYTMWSSDQSQFVSKLTGS